ncbi:hypothetical protein LCGC14_1225550 [marine sediment metagenome]|uniref:Uncharacterized protein n=1 Tax=marine sediment metagenome TaxID=412755 RepID=A0A0F9LX79_9ZZZZ
MSSKFHPDDLKNPLYEHSQIITIHELVAVYYGIDAQYRRTHWWQFKLRYGLKVSERILYTLVVWLQQGKPKL